MDATGLSVQDRQIGFVFQSYALFNHMTVADNIGFGIRIRKLGVNKEARRVPNLPCSGTLPLSRSCLSPN